MVQIIEENRRPQSPRGPSTADRFKNAFATAVDVGAKTYLSQYEKKMQAEKLAKKRKTIEQLTGLDLGDVDDEDFLDKAFELGFKNQSQYKKFADELKGNRQVISDLEQRRGLEPGSLSAYEHDPKLAESITRSKAEPRPRISEEPINEEQLRRINKTRNEPGYKESSPSIKYDRLTNNGVSRSNAESESKIYAEEEKIKVEKEKAEEKKTAEQKKQNFDEKIRGHKESEEYDKYVLSNSRTAKKTLGSVNEARNALKSGKVKPTSAVSVLSFFGDVGKTLANAIKTGDHASVQALIPEFLEGKKELFGVRLSDADLGLLQDKSIDISKSPQANEAILKLIQKYADQAVLRGDIASEISNKHQHYRPLGYERLVEEEFDRQMSPIEMSDSEGNSYSVPAYRVGSAIKKGLSVRNE